MTANAKLLCRTSRRRERLHFKNEGVALDKRYNGIDYAEFEDGRDSQFVHVEFLCPLPKNSGEVAKLELYDETDNKPVRFCVAEASTGDTHARLKVLAPLCPGRSYRVDAAGLKAIDPVYALYRFTAISNVVDVDPKQPAKCPLPKVAEPAPNYCARDFGSIRQLLLDRMALLVPEWSERHIPDLGVTLIELLAFVGDYFSYYQDAVGTEAYLHTARQRISVRRHTRLIDYMLHEGCNARTFVCLEVAGDPVLNTQDAYFTTKHPDLRFADQPVLAESTMERLAFGSYQPFEIMRLPTRCGSLTSDHLKNVVGLILFLIDSQSSPVVSESVCLAKILWNQFSATLRKQLRGYYCDAKGPPSSSLVDDLVAALNQIVDQLNLTNLLSVVLGSNVSDYLDPVRLIPAFKQSVYVLRKVLSDYFAVPDRTHVQLYEAHNEMCFYTWDQQECCLPVGTTRATLLDTACPDEMQPPEPQGKPVPTPAQSQNVVPDQECPSPFTAKHASDEWRLKNLSRGDVLILEEARGPRTLQIGDADPARRQAIRLTKVEFCIDPVTCNRLVEIEWQAEDALRFPLCISSVGPEGVCEYSNKISVARGNVVVVDHGQRTNRRWLGVTNYGLPTHTCGQDDDVPIDYEPPRSKWLRPLLEDSDITLSAPLRPNDTATCVLKHKAHDATPSIVVYGFPIRDPQPGSDFDPNAEPPTLILETDLERPQDLLARFAEMSIEEQRRLEDIFSPAAAQFLRRKREPKDLEALVRSVDAQRRSAASKSATNKKPKDEPIDAVGAKEFTDFQKELRKAVSWEPKSHLLESGPGDRHVVVEMDDERRPHLRFGDNELGQLPPDGTSFYATYRRGNGVVGNVGAEAIHHLVYRNEQLGGVTRVRNPLPAEGGTDPETVDHAKWHAPQQFKKLRRAIVAKDYADLVMQHFANQIQQARATLHWTGFKYEVQVAIDPKKTEQDPTKLAKLTRDVKVLLAGAGRIGHRLSVKPPKYVGLQIDMLVCVSAGHLRSHVQRELRERFSDRVTSDGTLGFFHPDKFTFGDELYLSRLVTEARQVEGVENVDITRFERYGQGDQGERNAGVMKFGPLEIPRLDNDSRRPELGRFLLDVRGQR